MSTSIIWLLPTDPEYVPDALAQERAVELLKPLLLAPSSGSEISARVTEQIEFLDPGPENFERIVCPVCSVELPIDWWGKEMDRAYEKQFTDLRVTTPCCNNESSLNELNYEWPAGFARFAIELYEPFVLDPQGVWQMVELSDDTVGTLQETLGCELRVIRTLI
jgi:hypothetical protein